jgi:putative spermidine/putrescine transport system ATP-binding protein
MADRIAIMNAGRVMQIGTPRELYESPNSMFIASFLGETNILPVADIRPERPGLCLAQTGDGLAIRAAAPASIAGTVVLSIRPENIELDDPGRAAENRFRGTVSEAVYTAGSIRYRVKIADGVVLTLRVQSRHGVRVYAVGDPVEVSWRASTTLVIPEGT